MAREVPEAGSADREPLPRPSASAPHPHSPSPDELRRRLRVRLERHLSSAGFRPALTLVGFRGGHSQVLRHGIEQPEDVILGFELPASFGAVGVLASSVVATPPRRDHRDAALALGVCRSGYVVSLLATNTEVIDTHKPQGWLIDACRRSVGLATDSCDVAPLAFPIALWLDRLMVAILNAPAAAPVRWNDAVDLCPIPRQWRSRDPIDLGTTLGSTTRSWKALRLDATRGEPSPSGVSADLAVWMDEPMFARWCMGTFPDLASLRGDVEFLAPADVAEHIELALRAAWLSFDGSG